MRKLLTLAITVIALAACTCDEARIKREQAEAAHADYWREQMMLMGYTYHNPTETGYNQLFSDIVQSEIHRQSTARYKYYLKTHRAMLDNKPDPIPDYDTLQSLYIMQREVNRP